MPLRCRLCVSPLRGAVEALVDGGTMSARKVAIDFDLPKQTVWRHLREHPRLVETAKAEKPDPFGIGKTARAAEVERPAADVPADPLDFFRLAFQADPHPWQEAYLVETRNAITLKGRQVGASTAAASLCLHAAMHKPGSLSCIVSPSLRQSQEIAMKARLGAWELGEKLVQDSTSLLRFANGSRLLSLPGSPRAVRGYAVDGVLVMDEAAWIDQLTWDAARPTTSMAKGRTVVQSTPDLLDSWFGQLWTAESDAWAKFKVRSDGVLDAETLERERAGMRPGLFAAEYLCEFDAAMDVGVGLWQMDQWAALERQPEAKE